ncbi:MAG: hypothetical protein R2705_15395 [Ilumatobacteraceae bacterium]
MQANGLEVVSMSGTSKLVSPVLLAGVLAQRSPQLGSVVIRVLTALRLGKLPVPYRAGDLITVVAVKPCPLTDRSG